VATLLWLQAGACSGNTISLLQADEPTVVDLLTDFGVDLLWHPSLGPELGEAAQKILADLRVGRRRSTSSCRGHRHRRARTAPVGWTCSPDRPMTDWITDLTPGRRSSSAIGDCACLRWNPADGAAEPERVDRSAVPPRGEGRLPRQGLGEQGRPAGDQHPGLPGAPRLDQPDPRGRRHRPRRRPRARRVPPPEHVLQDVHAERLHPQQFFEYKQSTTEFGQGTRTGCLFYELGCRGPMTHSPCNRILWNRQSSKTRAGHPCLGCTEPRVPARRPRCPAPCSRRRRWPGHPARRLPTGADHLTYMAAAAAARMAAPQWSKEDMFVV
jgi:Ni,Fe-hydrogenase I small subunit